MKCYTIKFGDKFIANEAQCLTNNYHDGLTIKMVDDIDDAKHYKNQSLPKTWIKTNIGKFEDKVLAINKNIERKLKEPDPYNYNQYAIPRLQEKLKIVENGLDSLKNAEIFGFTTESPNFMKANNVKWNYWRMQTGSHSKSLISMEQDKTNKHSCSCCGLRLKNVPYYNLYEGNPKRVCIPCLYIRMDAIKAAFEGMDEEYRTEIVNELILGSL